uniref:Rhodanese domain-containing protein n=1 Tax=Anas platyrhynchos TaxID=8839 RepID=A0A8B9QM07_ANAPL
CGRCGRPAAATGGGRRCPVRRGDPGETPGELCSRRWPSLGEEGSAGLTGCASLAEPRAVGGSSRRLCAEAERGVSYEELKELKKSSVVHIDVRERWEVDRDGKIPASINIPLKELVEALQMDPTDFRELYNQKMPAKSDHVVFSCFAGSRSKQALNFATSLGFSRVQHFPGGFEEWAKREHPEKK